MDWFHVQQGVVSGLMLGEARHAEVVLVDVDGNEFTVDRVDTVGGRIVLRSAVSVKLDNARAWCEENDIPMWLDANRTQNHV